MRSRPQGAQNSEYGRSPPPRACAGLGGGRTLYIIIAYSDSCLHFAFQALLATGVIPGADMTVEGCLMKLSYVLGKEEWSTEKKRKVELDGHTVDFSLDR